MERIGNPFLVVVGSVLAFFSSPLAVALQCVFIALIIPDDQWSKQFRNVRVCVPRRSKDRVLFVQH